MEARFGRERGARDAAGTLDLDLLDYDGRQCSTATLELPLGSALVARLREATSGFALTRLRIGSAGVAAECRASAPGGQAMRGGGAVIRSYLSATMSHAHGEHGCAIPGPVGARRAPRAQNRYPVEPDASSSTSAVIRSGCSICG